MQCEQTREHLSAYLDRELTAELSAAVRAHVAGCAECRALLEELRATSDLLGRLPVRTSPHGVAGDVQREIERLMILEAGPAVEGQPQERTLALQRGRLWPRALAVAATLLLALGIGLFAYLGHPGQAPPAGDLAFWGRSPEVGEPAATGPGGGGRLENPESPKEDGGTLRGTPGGDRERSKLGNLSYGYAKAPATESLQMAAGDKAKALSDKAVEQHFYADREGTGAAPFSQPAKPAETAAGESRVASAAKPAVARTNGYTGGTTVGGGMAKVGGTVHDLGALKTPAVEGLTVDMKRTPDDSATTVTLADSATAGPAVVRGLMNAVANGEANMEALQRVATVDNLNRADNQLIIRAESRDEANRRLEELFVANGWFPLAKGGSGAGPGTRGPGQTRVHAKTTNGAYPQAATDQPADSQRKSGWAPTAAGVYFLAHHNGEDTWIVLTDRDNLSRFGGQLVLAHEMTVDSDSSPDFRALSKLQSELRRSTAAGAEKAGWVERSAGGGTPLALRVRQDQVGGEPMVTQRLEEAKKAEGEVLREEVAQPQVAIRAGRAGKAAAGAPEQWQQEKGIAVQPPAAPAKTATGYGLAEERPAAKTPPQAEQPKTPARAPEPQIQAGVAVARPAPAATLPPAALAPEAKPSAPAAAWPAAAPAEPAKPESAPVAVQKEVPPAREGMAKAKAGAVVGKGHRAGGEEGYDMLLLPQNQVLLVIRVQPVRAAEAKASISAERDKAAEKTAPAEKAVQPAAQH